ncbi:hypothetical protein ACJMK2_000075, partial [Sinanodonta woodiana]
LPVEILSMDDNSIQLYQKALDAGKEKVYNIRVMVVGQFGVGKTTLIKRLLGQPVDIAERKSTEGIDVHKHCCKISLDKGEWIEPVDDSDQLYILHRLNKLLSVQHQKPDISQEHNIGETIHQREIVEGPWSCIPVWAFGSCRHNRALLRLVHTITRRLEASPSSIAN